jgi:tetratricopeptide (TPR) repeat protein
MPYRILNPTHGVTDVLHLEPAAARESVVARSSGRFSAGVYFAAAEMLALEGHLQPALRSAERGMELEPPDAEAQALYAWLLYRCDRVGAAEVSAVVWSQIDCALARDSSCALAHYFKSVLLQRSGQVRKARWHLQRGRELDPSQSVADRALALLDDE